MIFENYFVIPTHAYGFLTSSTDLTCIHPDIYGSRYTGLQIWSSLCADYFLISCCLCYFHFVYHTGIMP